MSMIIKLLLALVVTIAARIIGADNYMTGWIACSVYFGCAHLTDTAYKKHRSRAGK
jgi:hypothetical protein